MLFIFTCVHFYKTNGTLCAEADFQIKFIYTEKPNKIMHTIFQHQTHRFDQKKRTNLFAPKDSFRIFDFLHSFRLLPFSVSIIIAFQLFFLSFCYHINLFTSFKSLRFNKIKKVCSWYCCYFPFFFVLFTSLFGFYSRNKKFVISIH